MFNSYGKNTFWTISLESIIWKCIPILYRKSGCVNVQYVVDVYLQWEAIKKVERTVLWPEMWEGKLTLAQG